MAAGLPVVNTQLDSGVPFVSLHEQTGLTVPFADSDALAAAIGRLLGDENLRLSLGNAARTRARQEFSLDVMASRTASLYCKLLNREEQAATPETAVHIRVAAAAGGTRGLVRADRARQMPTS